MLCGASPVAATKVKYSVAEPRIVGRFCFIVEKIWKKFLYLQQDLQMQGIIDFVLGRMGEWKKQKSNI